MTNKKLENIILYKIDGVALFEDRRYYKATCDRFLFIKKAFLKEFNQTQNYISSLKPISLIDEEQFQYIYITELKSLISVNDYNNLLCNILKLSNEYDKINILFPYLVDNNNFSSDIINRILAFSLTSKHVRNSFEAQSLMIDLAYKNKSIIDATLFHRILSDFPHKSGGIGWVETNKL